MELPAFLCNKDNDSLRISEVPEYNSGQPFRVVVHRLSGLGGSDAMALFPRDSGFSKTTTLLKNLL